MTETICRFNVENSNMKVTPKAINNMGMRDGSFTTTYCSITALGINGHLSKTTCCITHSGQHVLGVSVAVLYETGCGAFVDVGAVFRTPGTVLDG